jgi:hypothetical protein
MKYTMDVSVTEIVKAASDLTAPMAGTLSDAWHAVIGDRVAGWRLKNAAKLQVDVAEELGKLGLALNPARIPERYAFAWFEEASKQDEPEIQVLFARLLARAASGDPDATDRRQIEILSKFTPQDALALDLLFKRAPSKNGTPAIERPNPHVGYGEYALYKLVRDELGERGWQAIEHLLHLVVIERRTWVDNSSVERLVHQIQREPSWASESLEMEEEIWVTATGLSLYRAIRDK